MTFAARTLMGSDGATLRTATYTDDEAFPTNAKSGVRLATDGTLDWIFALGAANQYTWLTGSGVNSDYEARWTTTSGTLTSGTTGTWLGLGTLREWYVTRSSGGTSTVVGTLEIRAASSLAVLATATITLNATVS